MANYIFGALILKNNGAAQGRNSKRMADGAQRNPPFHQDLIKEIPPHTRLSPRRVAEWNGTSNQRST